MEFGLYCLNNFIDNECECIPDALLTSRQSNLTKSPHHRRTWTVQSYSPRCADMHSHVIRTSLDPPESSCKTTSRSVQPFFTAYGRVSLFTRGRLVSSSKLPLRKGIWTPSNTCFCSSSCIRLLKTLSNATYTTQYKSCLLYTSPSPRDRQKSRMPSSA